MYTRESWYIRYQGWTDSQRATLPCLGLAQWLSMTAYQLTGLFFIKVCVIINKIKGNVSRNIFNDQEINLILKLI